MARDLLLGTHERTIDEKGRLSLPVPFREKLGEKCFVSRRQGSDCVGIWTTDEFISTMERLQNFAKDEPKGQNELRLFSANAYEVRQDRSGRIMIPTAHREAIGLDKEVLVCGALTRVEIWNPQNWHQFTQAVPDNTETWM